MQNLRPIGWLSPTGEFIECTPYEHYNCAESIIKHYKYKRSLNIADDILLEYGWCKLCVSSLFGHCWKIDWRKELTPEQVRFLKPCFEADETDLLPIDQFCRDFFECECN